MRSRLRCPQNLAGHDAENQCRRNGEQKGSSHGNPYLRRWHGRAICCGGPVIGCRKRKAKVVGGRQSGVQQADDRQSDGSAIDCC